MQTELRWHSIHELKGWTLDPGSDPLVKQAHLKRHPRHDSYIPISKTKPLSEPEAETYGRLNLQLHHELRRVSQEHFAQTPVPPELKEDREPLFTPFTYQNYDWYGPSYECGVVVITDYISADLLRKFQSLLQGEYQDWCIQVVVSNTPDFSNDYEIAVFSDQIIVPVDAAKVMGVPKD